MFGGVTRTMLKPVADNPFCCRDDEMSQPAARCADDMTLYMPNTRDFPGTRFSTRGRPGHHALADAVGVPALPWTR